MSFLEITRAGSTVTIIEDAFFRPIGADAWSAYWPQNFIYETDVNRGLDIFFRTGPRIAKTPGPARRSASTRAPSNSDAPGMNGINSCSGARAPAHDTSRRDRKTSRARLELTGAALFGGDALLVQQRNTTQLSAVRPGNISRGRAHRGGSVYGRRWR
jgi:hypothetical protein